MASLIHGKTCKISSCDTQRGGNGLLTKKRGFRQTTAEKGIDATTVEQLLKEMENLKIAMVKKSDDRPTSFKYMHHRWIWCESTGHDRRDCDEHKEALP